GRRRRPPEALRLSPERARLREDDPQGAPPGLAPLGARRPAAGAADARLPRARRRPQPRRQARVGDQAPAAGARRRPAPGSGARAGEQRPHARRGASPRGLERRYPARLQRRLPPRRAGAAAAPDREGPRERPPSHLRRPRAAPRRAEGGAGRVSVVGIVLANDRSRPLEFWFKLDELSRVQLDELVAVDVFNPFNPDRPVTVYAVVDDLIDSVEGLAFPGDTELLEQGASYGRRILMAHARVLRFVPDVLRPPRPDRKSGA